jgi:hypothetical protein
LSIEPQYTFDNLGNPVGVFLPIDEWNRLSEAMHLDIPQWQKDLIDTRLATYYLPNTKTHLPNFNVRE